MATIYFVRHGEYDNPKNVNPFRLPGFPLSKNGIKQIKELAQYFKDKNISAIYSSPILRTKQTAEIIGYVLGIKPHMSPAIIEVDTPFQGYDRDYINNVIKNIYRNKFHLEQGGETIEKIYLRMKKFVDFISNKNKDKQIIIVSHGDPIMIFLLREKGLNFDEIEKEILIDKKYIPMGGVIKFTGSPQE